MKFALITFGNEESYGLLFVSGELKRFSQDRKFFDAEEPDVLERILEYGPDFLMFSPMTTFYKRALDLMLEVKRSQLLKSTSIIGGHHAMSVQDEVLKAGFDVCVVGPVRGSVGRILDGERGLIKIKPTEPSDLPFPDRERYYKDVPRMKNRYRKFVLSMLGCPWNCSYCSSSCGHMRDVFGLDDHKRYYLKRRSLDDVFNEVYDIIQHPTKEIEWVDDDIFYGDKEWLMKFAERWKKEELPLIYISTTSISALNTSCELLRAFSQITSAVGLGVQAARLDSLRLFNRQWDDEERMRKAYGRLYWSGFRVNLQAIVGLPVSDPVEDALDTVRLMQKIGKGSICSVYPLQVYPGTKLEKYCKDQSILLRSDAKGDTNTGETGIWFDELTTKRLRNICKLATMFVKYGVDEKWMRALIDVDMSDEASKMLSMTRYHDCVVDRLKDESVFDEIINATKLRY